MKYRFHNSFGDFKYVNPEMVVNEISKLDKLTPENIIKLAKNKDNPLHKCFEWDNTKAANLYRLQQARHLIKAIVIVDDDDEKKIEPIRAFVSVEEPFRYKPIHKLNEEDIDYVIKSAYNELQNFVNKYSKFEKLNDTIKVIKGLLKKN